MISIHMNKFERRLGDVQDWVRLFEGPELSFKSVRMRPGVRHSVRLKVGPLPARQAQHRR